MFLIPVERNNPVVNKPFATRAIVIANVLIFATTYFFMDFEATVYEFGFIPSEFKVLTLFTSLFLHGGFWHLLGNMYFLYMFGDNVEDIITWKVFIPVYLLLGVAANLTHYYYNSAPDMPAIGASGAISGIMGMYLVFYPKASFYISIGQNMQSANIKSNAFVAVGIWFVMQLVFNLISKSDSSEDNIAYMAHIGGFITGYIIGWILKATTVDENYYKNYGDKRIKLINENEKAIIRREQEDESLISFDKGEDTGKKWHSIGKDEYCCQFCGSVLILDKKELKEKSYVCAVCHKFNTKLKKQKEVTRTEKLEENEYYCSHCNSPVKLKKKEIAAGHFLCHNCNMENHKLVKEPIIIPDSELLAEDEYFCGKCGAIIKLSKDEIGAKVFICYSCNTENLELLKSKKDSLELLESE